MALAWLKDKTSKVRESVSAEVSKIRNKTFMEGVTAGCALVAAADGTVDSTEIQKMMSFIRESDALKNFKVDDVQASFRKYAEKIQGDKDFGPMAAYEAIGKVKDVTEKKMLVRVCCVIGAADGDFDDSERAVVAKIARELGLDPAEFDL